MERTSIESVGRELSRHGGRGRGGYPRSLRQAAAEATRAERARGASVRDCARRLGISRYTLSRWLKEARAAMRPIAVRTAEVETPREQVSGVRGIVLTTAGGQRYSGLTTSDVVQLVRELG